MSTWLRNLQGQLTELASEVLNEATEEVADPDTELQIVKKQASELEARLSASTREIERLQAACKESEEQAEASQLQNETLSDRYRGLLEAREADIRNLQTQLQQLQISADDGGHSSFHHSFTSSSPPLSPNAQDIQLQQSRDEVKQLKAEVAHWKNVVKQSEGGDAQHEVVNLRQELSSMTDKHQAEIASLQHAHFENVRSLRTQYEMRIASLQVEMQSATASDIGSKPPTHGDDGWNTSWDEEDNWKGTGSMSEYSAPSLEDAASQKTATSDLVAQLEDMQRKYEQLQVDKAGLMEETARLVDSVQRERHQNLAASSEVDSLKYEAAERELDDARNKIVELELQVSSLQQNLETLDGQHEEVIEHLRSSHKAALAKLEQQLLEANQSLAEAHKSNEKLKTENQELTSAYNDLNDEYESHKAEFGSVVTSNRDLNTRIESLKADLIEYEEKYERCKSENAATAKQLDVLTTEFDRLKFGFEAARSATSAADVKLAGEVERLQEELMSSQQQREKLMSDVGEFNNSIAKIDSELSGLRSSNRELMNENRDLRESIGNLSGLKDVFSDTEGELHQLRVQLKQFQIEQLKMEHALRSQLQESLENCNDLEKQLAECKSRAETAESALVRYRSVVGEDAANIVEMKNDGEKKKTNSSGGGSDGSGESNSGWDKLGEWEQDDGAVGGAAAAAARAPSADRPISQMELQMREALAAVTEKTEECEELNKKLISKTQELQERDELLQQAFTELKGLECQLSESRERESNLRVNVQRLTVETARKDEEIQAIREGLEAAQSAQTDLSLQLEGAERHLLEDRRNMDAVQELQSVSDFAQQQSEEIARLEKSRADAEALAEAAEQRAAAAEANLAAKDARIARFNADSSNLDSQLESLADQKAELESELCSLQETNTMLSVQVEELQGQLKQLAHAMEEARKAADAREADVERLSSQLASAAVVSVAEAEKNQFAEKLASAEAKANALDAEKQQLIALVQQKHDESVRYHAELQKQAQAVTELQGRAQVADHTVATLQQQLSAASAELASLKSENAQWSAEHAKLVESKSLNGNAAAQSARELSVERERAEQLVAQLRAAEEERAKASKEMERLREHLLMIEENYTRDAVAAEERETELRQRVRLLEQEVNVKSESARDSTNQLQDTLGDLGVQLESMTGQRDAALNELSTMQRQLAENKKALTSLQGVLRDMESESRVESSAESDRMRAENESLRAAVQNLSGHLEQLKSAYAESEANREQMDRQMRDVSTTLSRREDELRAVEERLAEAQAKPSASASKGARQAADQEVLRNLFLSYFTAPNDKKREVAHLLASVLGFSAEEIKKMDGGAVSGWLGFLRGGGGNTPDTSITEQFIKFLETESTVAANAGKAHALPTDFQRASSVPVGGPSSGRSTPAFAFGHQRPPSIGQASLLTGPVDMPALNSPLRPPVDRTSDALKEMLQD